MKDKQEEILKVGLLIILLPFILAFITAYFIWKDEINTVFNEIFG